MKIKISCPAKINLTLEILNKREDGFHNIKSIMQTISLYDYLTISAVEDSFYNIQLSGNSPEIPYNEKNLVYKACEAFLKKSGIKANIDIYIEKHIPVSAGLAGGSTDAAGTLFGLNELFDRPLSRSEIHNLCSELGSDLNVCLEGGCVLAQGRGEIIKKLDINMDYPLTLIKPKNLGISAKEAYTKYASLKDKPQNNMTEKLLEAFRSNLEIKNFLYNDLETAVFKDYPELRTIKKSIPEAIMSGSGSTYFVLKNSIDTVLNEDFQIIEGLHFIPDGVKCNNFVTN